MTSDLLLQVANGYVPAESQWAELQTVIMEKLSDNLIQDSGKLDNPSFQFIEQTIKEFQRYIIHVINCYTNLIDHPIRYSECVSWC